MAHCKTVQSCRLYEKDFYVKLIRYKNWKIKNHEILSNIFSRIPLKFKGCINAKQQWDVLFVSSLVDKLANIHELILLISRDHVLITTFSSSFTCFSKRNALCIQLIKTLFRCLYFRNVLVLVRLMNILIFLWFFGGQITVTQILARSQES